MQTSTELKVTYNDIIISPSDGAKVDEILTKILGYSVWCEEILIAPRTSKEFALRKAIIRRFTVPNYSQNEQANDFEVFENTREKVGDLLAFDTISNTREPVLLVLDDQSGVYKSS